MKHLRIIAVLMLVAFAYACFFSMPVLSSDEWPWDADEDPNVNGSESPGDPNDDSDTVVVDLPDYSSNSYDTSFWLLGFMFRSSYHFVIIYLGNSQVNSGDRHIYQEAVNKVASSDPVKKGSPHAPVK
jgi:hypothetical protein